jgi:hypothetical protein
MPRDHPTPPSARQSLMSRNRCTGYPYEGLQSGLGSSGRPPSASLRPPGGRLNAQALRRRGDPPYYVKGHKLYKNFYKPEDHEEIAGALRKKRRANWVVSYDDVPQIRSAYSAFDPITYLLNYSAGEKSEGPEVIFLSDSLKAPTVTGFSVHHARRTTSKKAAEPSKKVNASKARKLA